jgi:hypothetical protein
MRGIRDIRGIRDSTVRLLGPVSKMPCRDSTRAFSPIN